MPLIESEYAYLPYTTQTGVNTDEFAVDKPLQANEKAKDKLILSVS